MNLSRRVVLLAILSGTFFAAEAQVPELQVAGRVVDATKGTPIAGAKVVVAKDWNLPGKSGTEVAAITDATGAFGFRRLPDGDYNIWAFRDGYIEVTDGSGVVQSIILKINPDSKLREVEVRLLRAAQISGVVVDAAGAPVRSGVTVIPVRVGRQADGSTRYLGAGSGGTTDAEGRFTIPGVRPGRYLVCVNCSIRFDPATDSIVDFGDQGLTWYGNTPDVAAASAITFAEGERRTLRIVARPMRLHDVIIRPVGPPPATVPWIGSRVAEAPESYEIHLAEHFERAEQQSDGSYRIRNLTPGHYSMVGYAKLHAVDVGAGEKEFDISDADGDVTVNMTIGGFGSVHGTVKRDEPPGPSAQDAIRLVWAGDRYRGGYPYMVSSIGVDGSFHITEQVIPGTYVFQLETKLPGTVLQSVRCNGIEVTAAAPLRIGDRQHTTGCEVTLGMSAPPR